MIDAVAVVRALDEAYGLAASDISRVDAGVATTNFRVTTDRGECFAKVYPEGADLDGELAGLQLGGEARRAGVPVSEVLETTDGQLLSRGQPALSLHAWCDGHTREPLPPAAAATAGAALGTIHRTFADRAESRAPSKRAGAFLAYDHDERRRWFETLLAEAESQAEGDEFAGRAVRLLGRRLSLLDELPRVLPALQDMPTQVIHGDSSVLNFLFTDDDAVAAVVDFRPPDPYFGDFELARIALDPETVVHRDDWAVGARHAYAAYLCEYPAARTPTTAKGPLLWLAHLLRSDYGVKQHLFDSHPSQQAGIDRYWEARCAASERLLGAADALEEMIMTMIDDAAGAQS